MLMINLKDISLIIPFKMMKNMNGKKLITILIYFIDTYQLKMKNAKKFVYLKQGEDAEVPNRLNRSFIEICKYITMNTMKIGMS